MPRTRSPSPVRNHIVKSPKRKVRSPKRRGRKTNEYCGCAGGASPHMEYANPGQPHNPRTGKYVSRRKSLEYAARLNPQPKSPRTGKFVKSPTRGRKQQEYDYEYANAHRSPRTGRFVRSPARGRKEKQAGLALGLLGGTALGLGLGAAATAPYRRPYYRRY